MEKYSSHKFSKIELFAITPRVKRVKHYAATIARDASHDKEGGKTQNKEQLDAHSNGGKTRVTEEQRHV